MYAYISIYIYNNIDRSIEGLPELIDDAAKMGDVLAAMVNFKDELLSFSRYGGVFLLLQQRLKHPREMIITPKAATSSLAQTNNNSGKP